MSLWDEKSNNKSKWISGFVSLVFIFLLVLVLYTPYSYDNVCKKQFIFDEARYTYSLKEIFSSVICQYPHGNLTENKTENSLNLSINFLFNDSNKENVIINELSVRKQMVGMVLFLFKFCMVIVITFFILFSWFNNLKRNIIDEIKDSVLYASLMWHWILGLIILVYFILGWF